MRGLRQRLGIVVEQGGFFPAKCLEQLGREGLLQFLGGDAVLTRKGL